MKTTEDIEPIVRCHKCNGLGKQRTLFSSNERWKPCDHCRGSGFISRVPKSATADPVEPSNITTLRELKREEQKPAKRGPKPPTKRLESYKRTEAEPSALSPDLRCNLCEQRALIRFGDEQYCSRHGQEKLEMIHGPKV